MARLKAKNPGPPALPGTAGGKKSKKQAEDPYKKATVLIPLTYNDGTQIPIDVLLNIKEELTVNFMGHTDEGTVNGEYVMNSGLKHADKLMRLYVYLRESQLTLLEHMVGRWAFDLGQETMLLEIANVVVKFLPPLRRSAEP
jgi:hypothetical protein